jgi:hypothetical protein
MTVALAAGSLGSVPAIDRSAADAPPDAGSGITNGVALESSLLQNIAFFKFMLLHSLVFRSPLIGNHTPETQVHEEHQA